MILREIINRRVIKQGAENYSQFGKFISRMKLKRANQPLNNKILVTLLINKVKKQYYKLEIVISYFKLLLY